MARTKNRGYQQTLAPTYTARFWKMGGYIRLSREDLQKINRGLDDSNSVKNQRDILNDFHHNHIDEFESYVEYVDDGHTGTDTECESFQRLLGDVMSGKINCVVVKDLSRFARNYSDAGSLIDNLFVQMGVRFIFCFSQKIPFLNRIVTSRLQNLKAHVYGHRSQTPNQRLQKPSTKSNFLTNTYLIFSVIYFR